MGDKAMTGPLGRRVALSVSVVKNAARPGSGCYYLMDSNLPGFGIRVYPTKTTYVVGRRRIGDAAVMPFQQAKELARKTLLRREVSRQANLDSLFVEQARRYLDAEQFDILLQAALDEYAQLTEVAPEALRVADRTLFDLCERLREEGEADPDKSPRALSKDLAHWRNHILPFEVKLVTGETRPLEKVRVRAVTQEHILALKRHLGSQPHTANKCLDLLHRAFTKAATWQPAWRLAATNPVAGVTRYDCHPRERTVREEEFALLFTAIAEMRAAGRGEPMLSVMEFNLLNGSRPGEPLKFLWSELRQEPDGSAGTIRILTAKTDRDGQPKGRTIAFGPRSLAILLRQPRVPGNPYVFAGREPGQPCGYSTFSRWWQKVCRRAGLPDEVVPYCARHSFASEADEAAVPITQAKDLMGHSQITTTDRVYRKPKRRNLLEAARRMEEHLLRLAEGEPAERA
jgi:integrase